MERLKVYSKDESFFIELPKTRAITSGGEMVKKEVQMAAGNIVQYVQGFRHVLTVEYDYFPSALLAQLTSLLRQGGWFKVDYFDVDGTNKSGYFSITTSSMGVFKYTNGVAMWHGLTLTFTAREVE